MNAISITECLKRNAGEVVAAVCGTVKQVWPQKNGVGPKGPWSVQGMELTDGAGTITAQFWNRPPMDPQGLVGLFCLIEAKEVKGRLVGVKMDSHTHEGQTSLRIKVQESASLTFGTSAQSMQPPQQQSSIPAQAPVFDTLPASQPTQAPTPVRQPLVTQHTPADEARFAKALLDHLEQLAQIYWGCLRAAHSVARTSEANTGRVMEQPAVSAMATTFFIQIQKEGKTANVRNLLQYMPAMDLQYLPENQVAPQEDVPADGNNQDGWAR